MTSRILRTVVLANSLLLALPTGWWCAFIVASSAPSQSKPNSVEAVAETGCCCKKQADPRDDGCSPCDHQKQSECPICCCAEPEPAKLVPAENFQVDLTDVGHLILPHYVPAPAGIAEFAFFSAPPSRAIHLLHCLWLC